MESWPRREHYRYYTEVQGRIQHDGAWWMCKTCSVSVIHGYKSTQWRFTASPRHWAASRTSACSKTRTANPVSGIKSCRISRSFIRMTAHFPTAGRTFPRISHVLQRHYRRYADRQGCQASRPSRTSLRILYCGILYAVDGVYRLRQPRRGRTACILPIVVMGRYENAATRSICRSISPLHMRWQMDTTPVCSSGICRRTDALH